MLIVFAQVSSLNSVHPIAFHSLFSAGRRRCRYILLPRASATGGGRVVGRESCLHNLCSAQEVLSRCSSLQLLCHCTCPATYCAGNYEREMNQRLLGRLPASLFLLVFSAAFASACVTDSLLCTLPKDHCLEFDRWHRAHRNVVLQRRQRMYCSALGYLIFQRAFSRLDHTILKHPTLLLGVMILCELSLAVTWTRNDSDTRMVALLCWTGYGFAFFSLSFKLSILYLTKQNEVEKRTEQSSTVLSTASSLCLSAEEELGTTEHSCH